MRMAWLLLILACAGPMEISGSADARTPEAHVAHNESVQTVIQTARQKFQQALKLDYAWRVTADLISEAEKRMAAGDTQGAHDAATRALLSAEASILQAEHESRVWRERLPKTATSNVKK